MALILSCAILLINCGYGGMADALGLGPSALGHGGSSPSTRTKTSKAGRVIHEC
jgi:hypothetical protein